jgi:hypothetical protein
MENDSELILYTNSKGEIKVEARFFDNSVWLSAEQIGQLYQKARSTIVEHIKNIFEEGELDERVVCRNFRQTTQHGAILDKTQSSNVKFYNLDIILAVGYRVKSAQGTKFRQWATAKLNEFVQKGFIINDEQMKELGGGQYWDELKSRFQDIRSSEKIFWRQVLDIFATSVDYDPKTDEAKKFFQMVQNKMHFAVHGSTAAEIIYNRANSEHDFMGLTTFNGALPNKSEIVIAKNYLSESELRSLNQLVSGYLDFAENQAERRIPMYMSDWTKHIDRILSATDRELLKDAGKISRIQAERKAETEYNKFHDRIKTSLSDVEKHFIENLKEIEANVNSIKPNKEE